MAEQYVVRARESAVMGLTHEVARADSRHPIVIAATAEQARIVAAAFTEASRRSEALRTAVVAAEVERAFAGVSR